MSLNKLFNPKSIAVIGASDKKGSVGLALFQNALNSKISRDVYAVNIKGKKILGHKSFKSVLDIKKNIDLAVVATPAKIVPFVMKEIAESNIKAVVIISAGFSEIGRDGKKLSQEIQRIATENNIRVMGPNCLGFISPTVDLNMSFASKSADKGSVALVSQSGAICTALLDWSENENIGFSNFVSVGSMIDICHADLIEYLNKDKNTKSIVVYMETINDSAKFIEACKKTKKKIFVLKSGTTAAGASAARSHTGSLAGSDEAFDALFRQAGVKRLENIEEMFDVIKLESHTKKIGEKLAIITNAGGPGVISTDALSKAGGDLVKLGIDTISKLDAVLPTSWSKSNPIDLIGDAPPQRYSDALSICLRDKNIDSILVLLSPQAMTKPEDVAKILTGIRIPANKFVYAVFIGGTELIKAKETLKKNNIAVFDTPERAVKAFVLASNDQSAKTDGAFRELFNDAKIKKINAIIDSAKDKRKNKLSESDSKSILSIAGAPVLKSTVVEKVADIEKQLRGIRYPLVMKIASADILHKVDCGGVELEVENLINAKKAFNKILKSSKKHHPKACIDGVYIESMLDFDLELIIGLSSDPVLGPVIMFGRGGTEVELQKDIAFGVLPMSKSEILEMMAETKVYQLLKGYRGSEGYDIDKIVELIILIQSLTMEFSKIKELDINPLALNKKGMFVLDGKIVLS